jgi:hypothetical protein
MDDTILPRIRSCLAGESASREWIASILLKKLRLHHPSLAPDRRQHGIFIARQPTCRFFRPVTL